MYLFSKKKIVVKLIYGECIGMFRIVQFMYWHIVSLDDYSWLIHHNPGLACLAYSRNLWGILK